MQRARRLATHLVQIIGQIGWRFNQKTEDTDTREYYRRYESPEEAERRAAHFVVEGERLFMSITERQSRTERPLTPEEVKERKKDPRMFWYRDRYKYSASGELTLHVSTSTGSGGFVSYRDSKRGPIEARVSDVTRSLLKGALDIKKRRHQAKEAEKHRRAEEARQERIRANREAHRKLIAQLEAEAGAWERAQRLRRYLEAVAGVFPGGGGLEVSLEGQNVNLLEIGHAFADQLDPLHSAPRTGAYFAKNDPYATGNTCGSDDSGIKKFVSRLLGADWTNTGKHLVAEKTTEPKTQSPGALLGLTPRDGDDP